MPGDPVVQPVYVDPNGKPLSVRMLAAYGSPGHYSLMLLESDRSTIVKDWGNRKFTKPEENTHDLPGTAAENIGSILRTHIRRNRRSEWGVRRSHDSPSEQGIRWKLHGFRDHPG